MGLGQYDSLGEYCGPHTASSVFLALIFPGKPARLIELYGDHVVMCFSSSLGGLNNAFLQTETNL